jgi:hypothetical protein
VYVPKHRQDTKTDAALEAGLETAIQSARLSRRGILAAVAVVGVTGGAASAATFMPAKHRRAYHGQGRPLVRGPKHHHHHNPAPSPAPSSSPSPTPSPTPSPSPSSNPTPSPGTGAGRALIGMNAPTALWDQRVAEVGPGLAARRIFADLAKGPDHGIRQVEAAHAAGLLPVISYKEGGDVAGAVAGKFNAVAEQAAARLVSYGYPTAVTFWHEPNGDLSGADYVKASKQLLPAFKQGKLKVGPILNGWLLDRQVAQFESFAPNEMFGLWDWFGMDTYESGTLSNPSAYKPAACIRDMATFVKSRGHDLPLGVGEYNALSAAQITAAGEALLSTPNVWFGCLWNDNLDFATVLTGDRLTAFRQTLADPRSAEPRKA